MLMICAAVLAVCVTRTHRRRPWDGLLVALAPAAALTATINWDLLAVALTAAGMLMWARSRPLAAGVLIGLATAAKLYPVLLLGPLLVLCWRAGAWRAYGRALTGAVASWLVVNLPVMITHDGAGFHIREGWAKFYTFSQERPIDFGSLWLLISQRTGNPLENANTYATLLMILGCGAIGLLTLYAPRGPLRAAGVPRRRPVHPHQQGLLAAVRPVADPTCRAGPAALAGLPDLAGLRGHVLPGHLDVPRLHR